MYEISWYNCSDYHYQSEVYESTFLFQSRLEELVSQSKDERYGIADVEIAWVRRIPLPIDSFIKE